MEPTIAYESTPSAVGSSADVSRANVGFVVGGQPKFADETADLLRGRLLAVTLALTVILSLAWIGSLVQGIFLLLWFRVLIFAVLTACLVGLRSRRPFSLLQLRGIELVVFGAVVIQVSLMWDQHQEVAESSLDLKREPVDATIELTLDETTQRGI